MNGRRITSPYKIAIVWRGDREARRDCDTSKQSLPPHLRGADAARHPCRARGLCRGICRRGARAAAGVDGVLVWVDPIHQGKTRAALDPLLRDVAARGPWVSAHPDVILKMGVKEVLYRTQTSRLGHRHPPLPTARRDFASAFPLRLNRSGPRVLKQNRGNGGQGVWKVELVSELAGEAASCACCMRSAAACRKKCRWRTS